MSVSSPPPLPPPYDPVVVTTPAKSGLPWYAWVGIGCLALAVLGLGSCFVLYKFAANKVSGYADKFEKNPELAAIELAVGLNPDVEIVATDEANRRITLRDIKTGKISTLDFEQIKEGKFSVETEEGTTAIGVGGNEGGGQLEVTTPDGETAVISGGVGAGNLPNWLPTYPGATSQGTFSVSGPRGGGTATFQTTDSVDDVLTFYHRELTAAGLTVDKNTYQVNNATAGGTVSGKSADGGREVTVLAGGQDGATSISLTYNNQE